MLWKEIGIGFLLAGFVGLLPMDTFNTLFVTDAPSAVQTIQNVVVGPLIAVLSFVCSVGNVPLAAVLWSGGISFAGVMAFIFADLIVLPIVAIYRKYYGTAFALRISALMLLTMIAAALAVDGLFSIVGLVPTTRPSADDVFGEIGARLQARAQRHRARRLRALIALTRRRGATDPVCGMTVDRAKARHARGRRAHRVLLLRALPARLRRQGRAGARALSALRSRRGSRRPSPSPPPAGRRGGGAARPSRRSARRS